MIGFSVSLFGGFSKSNGVVTDSTTTLQWQDDYSDNGGSVKQATWIEAIEYCERLSLDGGGWKLPNKKELLSIVDYSRVEPSINSIFSHTTPDDYWSSTSHASSTSNAWIVSFFMGDTDDIDKTSSYSVRCVR